MRIEDSTCLVFDHGLGISIARRLAKKFKRVLYHSHWEDGFPTINKGIIGDGFEDIERCEDVFSVINEVDTWVFPDILHSGFQEHLVSLGKSVWGSRRADSLELYRQKFHKVLGEVGLDVPTFKAFQGLTAAREHLRTSEDKYLKISKWRGSMETRHWRSWDLDEGLLDVLAVRFGPAKELITFLVFDSIDTPLEIGSDTYCVDGRWPSLMLHGIEKKDASYLSAVTKIEDMPEPLLRVLEAFSPVLAKYQMRNQWSTEVRVLEDKSYFTDPTPRLGLPSTSSQLEAWGNFPEIVHAGANGELIEPEPEGMFTVEVIVNLKSEKGQWGIMEVPPQLGQWFKPANCGCIDGRLVFPCEPDSKLDSVGWLVAIGDTPTEAIEKLKEYVGLLPDGASADIANLADAIKTADDEAEADIEFTDKPMPEPAEVLA